MIKRMSNEANKIIEIIANVTLSTNFHRKIFENFVIGFCFIQISWTYTFPSNSILVTSIKFCTIFAAIERLINYLGEFFNAVRNNLNKVFN